MAHDIDLGGAPANEHCAQLGHTPGFAEINRFEVFAYKLALIARYGTPPEGCALRGHSNHHDFGTYRTLVLHVTDDSDTAVRAYAEKIEEGLGSWIEAGFTPPIHYDDGIAVIPREDPCELIIGALLTTRPDSQRPLRASCRIRDAARQSRHRCVPRTSQTCRTKPSRSRSIRMITDPCFRTAPMIDWETNARAAGHAVACNPLLQS